METTSKCTPGKVFLWTGIIIGNLEWYLYLLWAGTTDYETDTGPKIAWILLITQPLWAMFIFILYMGQHSDIRTGSERCKKIGISPIFMVAHQTKLLSGVDQIHHRFTIFFGLPELKFKLMALESLYRL